MEDNFIYQKKDFVKMGVPEGSFNYLIKNLQLEDSEYMTIKVLPNGIGAKFFTEKAMEIVLKHLKDKEKSNNKNELMLIQANKELKEENQNLKNTLAVIEAQYTKESTEIKLKMKDMELEHIKEISEKDFQITNLSNANGNFIKENHKLEEEKYNLEKELERLKNRGFFARLFNKD